MVHTANLDEVAGRERAEVYFAANPGTPSAVRRPELFFRSGTWVALLGPNVEEGITGFGATVEAALRSFDVRYCQLNRRSTEI
jgi:hypothetical protein